MFFVFGCWVLLFAAAAFAAFEWLLGGFVGGCWVCGLESELELELESMVAEFEVEDSGVAMMCGRR